MLGNTYTLTNSAGETITFNNYATGGSANFILLQDYPSFDIEVKSQEIAKEGQHGIWDFYSFYGKRLITFSGKIVGENELEVATIKDQLLRVVALPPQPVAGNDGYCTLSWTDELGRALQMQVKVTSPIRFNRPIADKRTLNFQLLLKADNPFLYSLTETSLAGLRGYEMGSITLPVTYPTSMPWVYEQTLTVDNTGTVQADTTIRLYGGTSFAITNPRITNLTTGRFMQINTSLADETEYIEMDGINGTVVDQDGNDLSGLLEAGSQFIKLEVGENILYYISDENEGATNPVVTRIEPDEVMTIDYFTRYI